MELVKEIYKSTDFLPKSEMYTLSSQMRRAAISIPSNIAESYRRKNRKEYIQFLSIADGSAAELETQLILAKEIYLTIDFSKGERLILEVQKMLGSLLIKLKMQSAPYTLHPTPYE